MKILAAAALSVLLVLVGVEAYRLWSEARNLQANYDAAKQKLSAAEADQKQLQADLEYVSQPQNFEKEVRARFNYRAPGETMIVIVPQVASSSAATSGSATSH